MDAFLKIREIGAGSYGKAVLYRDRSCNEVVVKSVQMRSMSLREREDALNEVKVLSCIRHPFIISYRDSFVKDDTLNIVMDYAAGGDLYSLIQRNRAQGLRFLESQVLRWLTQAMLALKYLHDKHILHRDLKTQNLFLTASGRLRLGDFGIAKVLDSTNAFAKTAIGTPFYLSPEICQELPYSWASDIWSIGCIIYELVCLRVPFDAKNIKTLVDKITRGIAPALPPNVSVELRQIYSDCMLRDYRARPSAHAILTRPVIKLAVRRMLREESAPSILP
jgi:NIMA (never in mitosis gene a)-related kinase 1/4/5